ERLGPGRLAAHEVRIDARLAGLLVLEQQIGHAGVSRNDEDPLIEVVPAAPPDQDVVEQGRGGGHRCAADLLHAVPAHHAATFSRSPAWGSIARGSRSAMNAGRGFSAPNGCTSRFDIAL